MTDTVKSNGRPWTLAVTPTAELNEGKGSNGSPYMNFRADIETSKGVKNRFVSVFNTQRFPTLIEDVKAALQDGSAKLTLRFDYSKGETVRILGVGPVDFRKAANDTASTEAGEPTGEPAAEAPAEAPVSETPNPMEGVVVETKKRRRRKAA